MVANGVTRFPIRFDLWFAILSSLLLLPPADSYVEVDRTWVRVRMSWAFRANFPRSAIASVALGREVPLSRGVHGFAGRWLVNGSGEGIVSIDLNPSGLGYLLGFPVGLKQILISIDNPADFIASLLDESQSTV